MEVHFIDVGCGDMTLIIMPNGTTFVIDCNITNENQKSVFEYMSKVMGNRTEINVFINTHRDADHMRGIKALHSKYPIKKIWDSGVPGTTTDSNEYQDYMFLRRTIGFTEVKTRTFYEYGDVKIRIFNAANSEYDDANSQSIVIKVEYKNKKSSVFITGDTDYRPWKEKIIPQYSVEDMKCAIFQAPHHGSITFFDDPSDEKSYYTNHLQKILPDITIISVGPNPYGLPDKKSIGLYEKYSKGSSKGNKVLTTNDKGNIKLVFGETGSWSMYTNQ